MSNNDLRSVLNLDGADLVEAPVHDVLALQHELAALSLEVLLLPHSDLELAHLLHLLSVHGCHVFLWGSLSDRGERDLKRRVTTGEKNNSDYDKKQSVLWSCPAKSFPREQNS